MIMPIFHHEVNHTYNIPIKSLNLNKDFKINGSGFFLGWVINGESNFNYVFYTDTEDGFILKKTPSYNTYIKETNQQPHLHVSFDTLELDYPNWTFGNILKDEQKNLKYTLYVPHNTVKLNFNVNVEK